MGPVHIFDTAEVCLFSGERKQLHLVLVDRVVSQHIVCAATWLAVWHCAIIAYA